MSHYMEHNKYIDTLAGFYVDNYPILSLSEEDVFEKYTNNLESLLKDRVWFKYASKIEKKNILDRLKTTSSLIDEIKTMIEAKHSNLHIKHISIGGSYLFKINNINDIDFNVIVSGSHFSYTDIYEVAEINKKLPVKVKRISIMIFGEDDFLSKTNVHDIIEVPDYIHTSLCMREGLVFPMRNVTIYGHLFNPKELDRKNLLVRIKGQLFHAELMLEDKVDLHKNDKARLLKSVGRIAEAFLFLSEGFQKLKLSPKNIFKKEKILSKSLHRIDILSWLQEAKNYIKFLSNET